MKRHTLTYILGQLNFNWMGGQVFVPDHKGENGLRQVKYKSPFLDEPVSVETEHWHAFAYDDSHFYCFAMGVDLPPWIPCKCRKEDLEEVQVNPDSLGDGPFRTALHRSLLKSQPILTAP